MPCWLRVLGVVQLLERGLVPAELAGSFGPSAKSSRACRERHFPAKSPGHEVANPKMAALRVYFCGSIRGGGGDRELYGRIIALLREYGRVLTEHIASGEEAGERGDRFIHDRDVAWLREADVVVAEVSQPSLGVGYELGRAVDMNKKILCLFRPSCGRVLSAMIRGADNGRSVMVRDYEPDEIEGILSEYFRVTFPSL
ncbi:2'-deoxynucleoside 5'-phosphate N-hydrolase 1 isoform X1 [Spea bombifrons]|uniref:2'-deoxynucleoside 5'-phosphate N-hydrolase 1 isoform X1 n=1 Tax=Spea bombifrons TaxID=233779 RepID=UPI0023497B62|nr:2'-deoxynucleoside 5'-phosphate N-hydrolase 1 isoform X1 [Spea bombifrons]